MIISSWFWINSLILSIGATAVFEITATHPERAKFSEKLNFRAILLVLEIIFVIIWASFFILIFSFIHLSNRNSFARLKDAGIPIGLFSPRWTWSSQLPELKIGMFFLARSSNDYVTKFMLLLGYHISSFNRWSIFISIHFWVIFRKLNRKKTLRSGGKP